MKGDLGGSQFTAITDHVAAVVQSQIIERWEANDEQTHFRTIRDRVLSLDTQQRREVLGTYQRVLDEGMVLSEDTLDQMALRLTGLVTKWDGKLRGANRIYLTVFDSEWVRGELARLCPFSEQMVAWMVDRDSSKLLEGQALAEAWQWAKKQQRLGLDEYSFLQLSLNEIIKRTIKYITNQQNEHETYRNSVKEYQNAVGKSQDAHQNLIELLQTRQKKLERMLSIAQEIIVIHERIESINQQHNNMIKVVLLVFFYQIYSALLQLKGFLLKIL